MSFLGELKRRNVFRVAAAYVVVAWLVIQVVETILPAFGFGDAAVRVVTIALAIGIIPVLVVTWAFELTPEGLKLDREVEHDPAASRQARKRLDRIILVVLALGLGYFAFERFVLVPERTAREVEAAREAGRSEALIESYGEQSIAVLAFEDMSAEGDQAYLAEGIAEEILNLLARIPELRVISRSSAFAYRDKDVPIPIIAEQLNVAYILEGSVRRSGGRIRVTAQLIEARSDTQLWSDKYDRELGDIFEIQEELAKALVDELHITLLGSVPKAEPIHPEAYDLYLQALYLEDISAPVTGVLERAVEIEPQFADAWARLGIAYLRGANSIGLDNHEGDARFQQGLDAFERVASIEPDHPILLIHHGRLTLDSSGDYVTAARFFERALEEHPQDVNVLHETALFATMIQRHDLAAALSHVIVGREPLCSFCTYNYARRLMRIGRYEEAEQAVLRYKNVLPGKGGEVTLGTIRLLAGDLDGAEQAFSQREDEVGRRYGDLLVRAARGGNGKLLDEIAEFSKLESGFGAGNIAQLFAMAGDADTAFALLESRTANAAKWALALELASPLLQSLHSDPRWEMLEERAGVASHQLAKMRFAPRLPDSAMMFLRVLDEAATSTE